MNDAGQFYTNRVLKDWKDKSKTHVEWTKAWVSTLVDLQAFVKQHHTTGLVWNQKGGDAKAFGGTSLHFFSVLLVLYQYWNTFTFASLLKFYFKKYHFTC